MHPFRGKTASRCTSAHTQENVPTRASTATLLFHKSTASRSTCPAVTKTRSQNVRGISSLKGQLRRFFEVSGSQLNSLGTFVCTFPSLMANLKLERCADCLQMKFKDCLRTPTRLPTIIGNIACVTCCFAGRRK
uniref:Uncharacterized protein n=1 Tax=Rhipicephalus zambeziensis TaxID=60191 RepID=A0A224Y7B9_9ACAR